MFTNAPHVGHALSFLTPSAIHPLVVCNPPFVNLSCGCFKYLVPYYGTSPYRHLLHLPDLDVRRYSICQLVSSNVSRPFESPPFACKPFSCRLEICRIISEDSGMACYDPSLVRPEKDLQKSIGELPHSLGDRSVGSLSAILAQSLCQHVPLDASAHCSMFSFCVLHIYPAGYTADFQMF